MSNDEVSTAWLLKVARASLSSRNGEVFSSKLLNAQYNTEELEVLAGQIYEESTGDKLKSVDLSLFTNLLMAIVFNKNGYKLNNLEDCLQTLRTTVQGFKKIALMAQERLCKVLLEAVKEVEKSS